MFMENGREKLDGLVATRAGNADSSQAKAIKTKKRQNDSRNIVC